MYMYMQIHCGNICLYPLEAWLVYTASLSVASQYLAMTSGENAQAIWFSQQEIPRLNHVFNPSLSQLPTDFIPFPPGNSTTHVVAWQGFMMRIFPLPSTKFFKHVPVHAAGNMPYVCYEGCVKVRHLKLWWCTVWKMSYRGYTPKTNIAPEIRLEWKMSFLFVVFVSINSILVQERNPNLHSQIRF